MARYLEEPYRLSDEQLSSFDRDGFLILRDFLDEPTTQDIQKWSQEVHDLPYEPGKWMPYEEQKQDGSRALCRTENFADFHDGFRALFRGERMLGVLVQIMKEPMVLFKEKINYKHPGAGGFDAHTDAPAYQHAGVLKHLTINMAVDEATPENGCLEVVPGSHKMQVPIGDDNCIKSDWEKEQTWVPVALQPGDTLIFGSFLAHRSGSNNSSKRRAAIYATFNALSDGGDQRAAYYVKRRKEWPPTAERIQGKDYSMGAKQYGFGSPMWGATGQSRMQTERLGTVGLSKVAKAV
ncbi:2-aminoethylphosphonate dioxygenase [Malassezia yamatoensis]|jgi:2-aminoethylphosphonate dioxygenase|uniref:2-aminoethylphosphonate dioxygenase n=1 Tax=Malassezia yamatoensis TaxID=253288 RepID=A0AAJ5YUT1_9BASI|nr:2-aminoethylphosphonate dioxygenase [Malassezia yamatoensis]